MMFLRPWLLLLVIIPFLFNKLTKRLSSDNPWNRIIDPKLLPHLLVSNNHFPNQKYWANSLKTLWILFIVAISGPCINHIQIPAVQDLENTVLMLDLGPTMTPNVLNKAKTTLYDLVDSLPNNRIALVVYADKGYTTVPLTADKNVIKNLIPALNPSILPNTHNNPQTGFKRAEQLINQAGSQGRIIYLTAGGVNVQNVKSKYPIGVLNLGKEEDASPALKKLGFFQQYSFFNKQELSNLLQSTKPGSSQPNFENMEQTDLWLDIGGIICLMLLPFFAWTFRKGVLFVICMCLCAETANADFFVRQDQKLYKQEQEAIEAYHEKKYEQALSGFSHSPYNQGNTLAHMGKIPEAIEAYKLALQLKPNDTDAQFNKTYLEEQLKKQQQEQQNQQKEQPKEEQDSQDQQQESQGQDMDQNEQSNRNDSDDSQTQNKSQSDTENDTEQQNPKPQDDPSADTTSQPQEEESKDEQTQSAQLQTEENLQEMNHPIPLDTAQDQAPFNQQEQQILNRLNKDPSQVLRYRIHKQHMQGE